MGSGRARWAGPPNRWVRAPLPRMGRPNSFGVGTGRESVGTSNPGRWGRSGRPGSWPPRGDGNLAAPGVAAQSLWTAIGSVDGITRRKTAKAVLQRHLGRMQVERLQGRVPHRNDQGAGWDRWPRPGDRLGLAAACGVEALAVVGQQEAGGIGAGQEGTVGVEGPGRVQGGGRWHWLGQQRGWAGRTQGQQRRDCAWQPGHGSLKWAGGHAAWAIRCCAQSAGCARIDRSAGPL